MRFNSDDDDVHCPVLVILIVSRFVSYCYCCQHLWKASLPDGHEYKRPRYFLTANWRKMCFVCTQSNVLFICQFHIVSSFLLFIDKHMNMHAFTCISSLIYIYIYIRTHTHTHKQTHTHKHTHTHTHTHTYIYICFLLRLNP